MAKWHQKDIVESTTVWASLKGCGKRKLSLVQPTQFPRLHNQKRKDGAPERESHLHWGARVSGEADALQQSFETGVVAQCVHAGIDMKINQPMRMILVGFLEVFQRMIVFAQTDVDAREDVG